MQFTLPNTLTLIRVLLIPVFVIVYYMSFPHAQLWAIFIFWLAGFTDWLDGYLARKLNQSSAFGAFLDPVADKLMVCTALVVLVQSYPELWMLIPVLVVIGREITISALREWMASINASSSVAVSQMGKIKTAAQMMSIMLIIYGDPIVGFNVFTVGMAMFYFAALLTLWSMIIYLKAAWPLLKE